MTSESKRVTLSEVCEIVSSKRIFAADYLDEGIPFYRGKEISQLARGEKASTELFISEVVYQEALRRTGPVKSGDILLTAVGTLGNPYQVKETDLPFYFKDGNVLWMRNFSAELNPTFLFYWLNSSHGREKVLGAAIGSTQAALTISALGKLEVLLPSLEQQSGVVQMLALIDQKIELNKESSKILGAICQSLFKSWFIDFDPVKAKMAGEAPVGMDAETAALFSSSIREAPEGSIPLDWDWGSVGKIADVVDCLHSKKPALIDEGKPFLQLNTIADDGVLRYELAACVSDEDYSRWTSRIEVSGGDCVVTNVGRVGAVSQIPHHFKAAIGRNMTAVRPRESGETSSFLFTALTSDFMRREIEANTDSGTILDALNVKNIPLLKIPLPPRALIKKFEEVAGPMIRLRHELHRENVTLSSTRDALLPRLISGELEIPEEMLAA